MNDRDDRPIGEGYTGMIDPIRLRNAEASQITKMPVIKVSNGFSQNFAGLGRNLPVESLSEKRITEATRQFLIDKYGLDAIKVSSHVPLLDGAWEGRCRINGQQFTYRIFWAETAGETPPPIAKAISA